MKYKFNETLLTEGTKTFVRIPFNVWEETGKKGNIPCRICIEDISFECKLIPKGNGYYYIPINKNVLKQLNNQNKYEIEMEPIDKLSRINNNSPYSIDHPIRKIDSVKEISIIPGLCGHCVVAMLSGVPLEEVIHLMGKGHASWSKILETLDYFGIEYSPKTIYAKGEDCALPPCCILNNDNGFVLFYKGAYYGVRDIDPKKTMNYIEIKVN